MAVAESHRHRDAVHNDKSYALHSSCPFTSLNLVYRVTVLCSTRVRGHPPKSSSAPNSACKCVNFAQYLTHRPLLVIVSELILHVHRPLIPGFLIHNDPAVKVECS